MLGMLWVLRVLNMMVRTPGERIDVLKGINFIFIALKVIEVLLITTMMISL